MYMYSDPMQITTTDPYANNHYYMYKSICRKLELHGNVPIIGVQRLNYQQQRAQV